MHLTSKYFFCSNKSLHLFKMQGAFLLRFNPNLDFLQAVKVTKSGHHLSHDQASKGYGAIPGLTSQTSFHWCLQRLKVAPYSFLSARALISKISLWRKRSNSTPKSRARSRSKMPTDMASKLLKFVYRKCCVDRCRFQNIW